MLLYEKYRPQTLEEVLGQPKAVQTIERLLEKSWGGQAFWISGASGTGKTTLARIIASTGADEFCIEEYDSADQLDFAALDHIDLEQRQYGWGKGGTDMNSIALGMREDRNNCPGPAYRAGALK